MNFKLTFTIIITKVLQRFLRLMRLGGTSLPGEIARKLHPDILREISRDLSVIMVTGTNGKTTTTRIIGQILKENGIEYITNRSGANLVDGVASTLISAVDLKGRSHVKTALIEIDEAAFDKMTDHVKPNILVVTNFFRDQLDRYGELYTTLKRVRSGIEKSPDVRLVLNADDSLCASLGRDTGRPAIYYGLKETASPDQEEAANSDAVFCIYCKTRYEYSFHSYGHLGGFHCPGCGYGRPDTDVVCTGISDLTSTSSGISFSAGGETHTARVNLPGLYNIYNALAATAFGYASGFPTDSTVKALGSFECGFGRMESINTDGKTIKVILVKNPAGFNQVLNYLLTEDKNFQLAFLINDRIADGTDISWLWDVDFEKLNKSDDRLVNVYTAGTRAEDMLLRLKYAGLDTGRLEIEKEYDVLIGKGLDRTVQGGSFYILPTYTAMLDIRKVLKKRFGLKDFWK